MTYKGLFEKVYSLQQTAKQLDLSPQECLVIEDSKNGTLAAKAAGMTCIGFANPNSGDQDLSKADRIVQSIKDIHIEYLGL